MSSEEERIQELIFALRRDIKISKDIVNALSKIGPTIIPHLVKVYGTDDFAFKIRIIETLGKMNELGLSGLIELFDISEVDLKTTILKTIAKMEKYTTETNNILIDKMEAVLKWESYKKMGARELEHQIDILLAFRDQLVKVLRASKLNSNNMERLDEIAFLTFHIYLRKIQNIEINEMMKDIFSKLKKNITANLDELKDIYKAVFRIDSRLIETIRTNISRYLNKKQMQSIDKILLLIQEEFTRHIIYKNCDRNYYMYNYYSNETEYYPNITFYSGITEMVLKLDLDLIQDQEIVEGLASLKAKLEAAFSYDYDQELDSIPLEDIVGDSGKNQFIKLGIKNLDLSVKQLTRVNLDPLVRCMNLEFLNLEENQLTAIDLKPLQKCDNLQHLVLSNNKLPFIDLYPLRICKKLQWLNFSRNKIVTINLTPLGELTKLFELSLKDNKLITLDLEPLENCEQLIELDISNNNLETIDVTPLENCKQLEYFGVDDSTKLLWKKASLPKKEELSEGLQEHYSRLTIV